MYQLFGKGMTEVLLKSAALTAYVPVDNGDRSLGGLIAVIVIGVLILVAGVVAFLMDRKKKK